MGAPFSDMFAARTPGDDMEFCTLFGNDDIMHMLDLLTTEEKTSLNRKNIVRTLMGNNHVTLGIFLGCNVFCDLILFR